MDSAVVACQPADTKTGVQSPVLAVGKFSDGQSTTSCWTASLVGRLASPVIPGLLEHDLLEGCV